MTNEAGKKWDKENMKTLTCRVRADVAENFTAVCRNQGKTVHRVLSDFVQEQLTGKPVAETRRRNLAEENRQLRKQLNAAMTEIRVHKERADIAEKLVDDWLHRWDDVK